MDIGGMLGVVGPLLEVLKWVFGIYIVLLWMATVIWTYRDIHARHEEALLQVLAVSMALLIPFAGLGVYMMLRPRQTISDRYERSLEEEYLRHDIEEQFVCPQCQRGIDHEFILCPHCHTALRRRCISCDHVIDLTWAICPYCGDDGSGLVGLTTQVRMRESQGG
ncbi:MAG: zinc ribbon domain-containing protein [Chloroflexales bacterium]|nr:zinc ribbon domain-containing protein [Chloroflexales bacterium]